MLLAQHFLDHFARATNKPLRRIGRAAQDRLRAHHWPGNVRELRNVIERAVILETADELRPDNLPDFHIENRLRRDDAPAVPALGGQSLDEAVASYERALINRMLEQNRFSLTRTADQLGISRHSLRYRMQRLNIDLDDDGDDEKPALASPAGPGEKSGP